MNIKLTLTMNEVCKSTGFSRNRILKAIESEGLPFIRNNSEHGYGHYKFLKSEVEKWLNKIQQIH